MLPNTSKKTAYPKKQVNRVVFDKGTKLKPSKDKKKETKRKRGSLVLILVTLGLIVLTVFSTIFGIYSVYRTKKFYTTLQNTLVPLEGGCKEYSSFKPLNSVLFITLDTTNSLKNIDFVIYDAEKIIRTNFTNVEFFINKGGTRGTIRQYIESNNIYINNDKIFQNLSNLFLREFYMKIDHIVVSPEAFDFDAYLSKRSESRISKILDAGKQVKYETKTDVCKSSFEAFITDFTSEKRTIRTVNYTDTFRIADYFYLGEIKKEQIRVHINNATGVERWGGYFGRLLQNYGLNVVKIDTAGTVLPYSTIYIDDEKLEGSATVAQVVYLVDNLWDKPALENKTSIFSDIYIDVGEDFVIQ